MTLISDEYRAINQQLHEDEHFGRGGGGWYRVANELMDRFDTRDLLDYGCGKGRLAQRLAVEIKEYDPAVSGKEASPEPVDIVMCTDVLEHVEEECLHAVLLDLKRLVKKVGFFTISTRPARKTLPDGRNAHLLIRKPNWWLYKLAKHFKIRHVELDASGPGELVVIVSPKGEAKNETDPNIHRV